MHLVPPLVFRRALMSNFKHILLLLCQCYLLLCHFHSTLYLEYWYSINIHVLDRIASAKLRKYQILLLFHNYCWLSTLPECLVVQLKCQKCEMNKILTNADHNTKDKCSSARGKVGERYQGFYRKKIYDLRSIPPKIQTNVQKGWHMIGFRY